MHRLNFKAIGIGSAISIGGGLIAGLLFDVIYTMVLISNGVPKADLATRILEDPVFYVVSLLMGVLLMAGSAFAAARIAQHDELLNAGVVGLMATVIALFYVLIFDTTKWPVWYISLSVAQSLPVALVTGYIVRWRHRGSVVRRLTSA
jgi:hypothetical protein